MFLLIIIAIISYVSYRIYRSTLSTPNIDSHGKYVLISGCDTGFGYQLAIELDKQGFNILAGVYSRDNILSLHNKLSFNATVFHLDITNQNSIDTAFDIVTKKTKVLHALINNAGINDGYFIDWTSIDTMRKVMNVNFFGHVAMTKMFLSLLIAKRDSRVINMGSMCGYISLPGSSAYCASKYALESFSDCLRREMASWGLHKKKIRNSWNHLSTGNQQRYGDYFLNNTILQSINSGIVISAENPDIVIQATQHAVSNTKPFIRYRPGWQSKMFFLVSQLFPSDIMDSFLTMGPTLIPDAVHKQLTD
ncbi:unnamed protein product [Adineta steineri]|uniref:Uncharacterized protein n=1 Tax=Adineta steineri TaxID=433720 RepID=A0A816C440_9BILA|nr:unnamed protein product [Adineta steineri]CAF1619121.1 unnamed protein product [Adineta steineri]